VERATIIFFGGEDTYENENSDTYGENNANLFWIDHDLFQLSPKVNRCGFVDHRVVW